MQDSGECFTLFFILAIFAFNVYVQWRICSKTGNPGAISLLSLIPIVNLIMNCMLAFSEWPIEQEVTNLRSEVADLRRQLRQAQDELRSSL